MDDAFRYWTQTTQTKPETQALAAKIGLEIPRGTVRGISNEPDVSIVLAYYLSRSSASAQGYLFGSSLTLCCRRSQALQHEYSHVSSTRFLARMFGCYGRKDHGMDAQVGWCRGGEISIG